MDKDLLTISQAAQKLGVSINTLRRWDKSRKLCAVRKIAGGNRYYRKKDIDLFINDIFLLAQKWVLNAAENPVEPVEEYYCENSAVFQARLLRLDKELRTFKSFEQIASLLVAITGEIGNNSFDHNLGNWPDVMGIFFGYDLNKRQIILADRGQGIYATLKKVKPDLRDDQHALVVAFTEIISGRAPESRGNGLKFVKNVVEKNELELFFQSRGAELYLDKNNFNIKKAANTFHGCLSLIRF